MKAGGAERVVEMKETTSKAGECRLGRKCVISERTLMWEGNRESGRYKYRRIGPDYEI